MTTKACDFIELLRQIKANGKLTEESRKRLDELLDKSSLNPVKSDSPMYDQITFDDGSQIWVDEDKEKWYPLKGNDPIWDEGVNFNKFDDILSILRTIIQQRFSVVST